ncbi:MAG: hypothetical protein QOE45_2182 [Frankiaceae bacterium]|jgi:uncharacterized protein|nr:hypothetical protein [Frankiaceae bacterium]
MNGASKPRCAVLSTTVCATTEIAVPENRKVHSRLDPRQPLVIDTRELGRRPGSQRKTDFEVPAPSDLGVGMIGIPPGSRLDLRLRLEAVMEGVLVSGTVTGPLVGECARCLDPVASSIEVDLQELYAYPESDATEDEVGRLDGDLLDLEPALRDAVVLALPLMPLCREDCGGLCVVCGARRDDGDCGHDTAPVDVRWAALHEIAVTDETEQE